MQRDRVVFLTIRSVLANVDRRTIYHLRVTFVSL
jgi:hypothetical protein